jgi:HEAT repeat protein
MISLSLVLVASLAAAPANVGRHAKPTARDAPAAAASDAPSLSDQEVEERAHSYLGSLDTPVSAAQWKQLGSRAVPLLESVVRDPEVLPSRRARAVDALSMIGGARARQVVVETARSEDAPFGVRSAAVRAAPRVLSSRELSTELRPVLEHARRSPVRATAAEVLARHGGAAGCSAVRAQVEREHRDVRAQFTRAVDRCAAQQP